MNDSTPEQSPFTQQVRSLIKANLHDKDYTVYDLAKDVGLSYSQLARRLRNEAALTPTKLIRFIRAEYAAQLIESGHSNMTELTFLVGFNNLSYFSRCFKERFGMSPSKYARSVQINAHSGEGKP